MDDVTKRLLNTLDKRKEKQNFRELKDYSNYIDFLSNDYLGLAKASLLDFQVQRTQGGSSRLISGTTSFHLKLEDFLAKFFKSEAALIFNSGYDANIGLLSSVPKKGDVVLYDEFSHASIKDGLQLSHAKRLKFKHNNISDLSRLLDKYSDHTVFIVVEGLYSMDGDFAPLKEIDHLAQKYNAYLILDEAHSAGIIGQNGTGLSNYTNINTPFARIITFGKAFGAHGACVLSSQITKNYLINFARSFIYTTALPTSMIQKIHTVFVKSNFDILQKKLLFNIELFRSHVPKHCLKSDPASPIQIIDSIKLEKLLNLEKLLLEKGFGVKAILAPTVKEGSERLRVSIHATNKADDLKALGTLIATNVS